MRYPNALLLLALVGSLVTACSSTGSGNLSPSQGLAGKRTVLLKPNMEERAPENMPNLTSALRNAGFMVVSTGDANYEVVVTFAGGGFDLTCSIVMYERGVPVVSGKGVNPGFGVWLARDTAYRGVFQAALKQFSKRVKTL